MSPWGMENWRRRETSESTREGLDERREELERDWNERVRRASERLEEANREFQEQRALEYLQQEVERHREAVRLEGEAGVAEAEEWLRTEIERDRQDSRDAQLERVTRNSAVQEKLTDVEADDSEETSDSAVVRETLAVADIDSTEILRGVVEHVRYRDGKVMVELSANMAEILDEERTNSQETSDSVALHETWAVGDIRNKEALDRAVEQNLELKLQSRYESEYQEAVRYLERRRAFESEAVTPTLIDKLEEKEKRRFYETVHGGPPEIPIESMEDVDKLVQVHLGESERSNFDTMYRHCRMYFEIRGDWSKTREELSKIHGVGHSYAGDWRAGKEPRLIAKLRDLEEARICREWAQSREACDALRELHSAFASDLGTPLGQAFMEKAEIPRVDQKLVRESVVNSGESSIWIKAEIDLVLEKLYSNALQAQEPVVCADLGQGTGWDKTRIKGFQEYVHANQRELERVLESKFEGEVASTPRVAVVDGRLYMWTPKDREGELIDAYGNQYFYFGNAGEIAQLVRDLQTRLGTGETLYEAHKHSNRLLTDLLASDEIQLWGSPFNEAGQRVEGRVLRFYLDVMDMKLSDLEGRITKVTGPNGQAGIENPRFPEGEQLEILKARLAAIIASDCHLREAGRIGYNEEHLERIARVQEILHSFGDIELEPNLRKGSYEIHIQNQIGLMMIAEGMTPGNKAIQNPGLPEGYLSWSEEARRAYLEELIPEDGSFSASRGFSWFRSHALYDREANDQPGFKPMITAKEVELVKRKGKTRGGLVEQSGLAFGKLEKLQSSGNLEHAQAARNLVRAIWDNPNNLIEDEKRIAESLGIQIALLPSMVKYFPKSDRVSVKWTAKTATKDDAERWADICPPNDERKRNDVESWLRERVEKWLESAKWSSPREE